MKHKILIAAVIFMVFSLILYGGCYPIKFGQPVIDWYKGLSIPSLESYYFTYGKPLSMVGECHPKNQYIFAWEDGFYIWGVYGGLQQTQCRGIQCPTPQTNPFERVVFFAAESNGKETRFLIDSALWEPAFNFFNFDNTPGIVHIAGTLAPPKIKSSNVVLRGISRVILEIPLPKNGYYSDPGIDPASLISGVAVLMKNSKIAPSDLHTSEFEILKKVPVKIDKNKEIGEFYLETEVTFYPSAEGKPYFAYTLILEDGTSLDLDKKPLLPFASPVAKETPDLIIRSYTAEPIEFEQAGEISPVSINEPIYYVKAVKDGNFVDLEVKISEDLKNFELGIRRSFDLENWEPLFLEVTRDRQGYKIKEYFDFEPEMGIFYEIFLKDLETGKEIAKLRTMARSF